jgi:menaquinone-dependent protoporphyrinogen IX oxidase
LCFITSSIEGYIKKEIFKIINTANIDTKFFECNIKNLILSSILKTENYDDFINSSKIKIEDVEKTHKNIQEKYNNILNSYDIVYFNSIDEETKKWVKERSQIEQLKKQK